MKENVPVAQAATVSKEHSSLAMRAPAAFAAACAADAPGERTPDSRVMSPSPSRAPAQRSLFVPNRTSHQLSHLVDR